MSPEELEQLLTTRFSDHVSGSVVAYGNVTITLDAEGYLAAAQHCHDDERLSFDFFDCLIAVDERDEGFSVIANLYSTQTRARVLLRHLCPGGREKPVAPTLTPIWRGANWHEREAWDMFGIEFDGHPGLAPRILTAENFEGWPLRKDFPLATREAKPWPGAKEPGEGGHDASEGQREAQITSTTTSEGIKGQEEGGAREDTQAKAERARAKAAEMRRQKAAEREAADSGGAPAAPVADGPQEAPPATAADHRAQPTGGDAEAAAEQPAQQARPEAAPESLRHEEDTPQAFPEGRGSQPAPSTAEVTVEGQDEDAAPAERDEAVVAPGEETQSERAVRAAAESQAQDAQQPDGAHDQTSVPVEPPTTQDPGEAPVDGGIRETIDEQAAAGEHGQTPPQPPVDESEGPADGPKVMDLMTDASEPEVPARDDARDAGRDASGAIEGIEPVPPPESPAGPSPSPSTAEDAPAEQSPTPTDQPGHTSAEQPTDEGPGYAGSNEGEAERVREGDSDRDDGSTPPTSGGGS